MIASQANLTHSRTPVELIINTEALTLKRIQDGQTMCSHRMEGISFASAGEHVSNYLFRQQIVSMTTRKCQSVVFNRFLGDERLHRLCRQRQYESTRLSRSSLSR